MTVRSSLAIRLPSEVDPAGATSADQWKGMTYGGQSMVADGTGKVPSAHSDRDADVTAFKQEIGSKASSNGVFGRSPEPKSGPNVGNNSPGPLT